MLLLHRAERTERLAEALADVLREPLDDPFAAEVVSVPSKGVERWLAQRLSHRLGVTGDEDGVCANVLFPSVADLLEQVGLPGAGDDPWRPDRLVWPLLEVIDECTPEPWCHALGAYLGTLDGDPVRRGRRWATARHLAELFDSYGRHRPEMVRAWSAGDDTDGIRSRLPDDLCWQAELWRRLGKRMTVPSPAERLADVCETLRQHPHRSSLPQRLSVFGLTRLPAAHATLLDALAAGRDVHLWLPHPSPALWERIAPYAQERRTLPRTSDPTRDVPRHPLLASLGRDARELQLTLPGAASQHHAGPAFPRTMLGFLQQAVADDRGATGDLPVIDDADRSVQVHACHGPDRQVEVLREVILGLLAADPTLEPRDILVMCPDIETFAPLISASFGLGADAAHPAHRLRVRLADRALRQLNPLFGAVTHLLDLADARVTAAQVLDLAATAPVRRRFRFDDDDLDRLRELVVESGVRWGLDPEHRSQFHVTVRSNTWVAGLDRILLGAAMSEEEEPRWLETALPLDDVDSGDVDLTGRLAELVDRLGATLRSFTGERDVRAWLAAIGDAVDGLTDVSEADAWQRTQWDATLAELADQANDSVLGLADMRSLLAGRLGGSPTRANFRTGDLTMCTLVPMRSVPHRVICLFGLDDGVFPRGAGLDGDDVLGRIPCVGERDPRGEDRQLLLDAVMAATEVLVLLYSGADERTNAPRPPAVPLDELLDALGGRSVRDRVLTHHPLQPFDARNFTGEPFSFDRIALDGAVAATGERAGEPAFLATPLPPIGDDPVELTDLQAFFGHPVRAFLRRRLGVGLFDDDDDPADGLPIELDALQRWSVGDRLLRSMLRGTTLTDGVQAEWRRGAMPPGPLGVRLLDSIVAEAQPLADAAKTHVHGTPEAVDITVPLPDGRVLTGTVGDVYDDTVVAINFSRVSPKHRLKAWLNLLALTAANPGIPWRSVVVGRGQRGRPARSTFGPIDASVAAGLLAELVTLADEGLREPLALAPKTSYAYARCRISGKDVETAYGKARNEWTRFEGGGEAEEAEHCLVWGPESALEHAIGDPVRFDALALRLWAPLCQTEISEQL
ncbi:exodeoxyribonuclease V subunit gamma [Actinoplanes sp. M2I2]|uniref:exodeoxyribonuclease V subunit gamma n=1 Tax=Actinoplanes sp. M2I2 TaxID=1734444 RepID=UPI002021D3E3|nr:exodeoxyribonuclease V subunit gamma [Actinoplanes sp. M2I2]